MSLEIGSWLGIRSEETKLEVQLNYLAFTRHIERDCIEVAGMKL